MPTTSLPTEAASQRTSKPPRALSKIVIPGNRGVKVTCSFTVMQPARKLYEFWRNLENLVQIIKHPVEIVTLSDTESRWSVSAPGLGKVEWTALIINDDPGRLIAWRSADGAEVPNAGSVWFEPAPGDEGTEVTVSLEYDPPGGKIGALLAKLSGEEPKQQVREALRRFKALMEAGEIPTTTGQSVGEPQRSKEQAKETSP